MSKNTSNPLSILTVDLGAIARNWLSLKARLKEACVCAAVVKADAYGLGAEKVAPALHAAGCRHFFVAHENEGLALRGLLPGAEIYVLHGTDKPGLIPVQNVSANGPGIVHVDTGMNRLGVAWSDADFVMSHLACADEPEHPMNRAQLEKFKKLPGKRKSFANSSGIFLGEEYHFDMARPGCALYGINPTPHLPNPMESVVTLKARVLQIHDVAAGETVGYGAAYRAERPMRIATISAGYADGILRSIGKNGMVYVEGVSCAVVGRVSMDLITIDVSGVPGNPAWAELIGPHHPVDALAAEAGTIGYEVLTRLGRRFEREYV